MLETFHFDHWYSAVRITHFHHARVADGWFYGDHRHACLEFKYCVAGTFQMRIDGEIYTLHPGDAVVVKPEVYHCTLPVQGDVEFLVFHFDIEAERILAVFQRQISPLLSAGVDEERTIPGWIERFMAEFGEDLRNISRDGGQNPDEALFLLRVQSRLLELIGLLGEAALRRSGSADGAGEKPSQRLIARKAAYLIETHFPGELKIGELAGRLGIHRSYLFDCFKRVYGMSPRAYADRLRVRRAKFLLKDTPYTIDEISERLHFSSGAHFCRFFRKMTGTTPGRYRNPRS